MLGYYLFGFNDSIRLSLKKIVPQLIKCIITTYAFGQMN